MGDYEVVWVFGTYDLFCLISGRVVWSPYSVYPFNFLLFLGLCDVMTWRVGVMGIRPGGAFFMIDFYRYLGN